MTQGKIEEVKEKGKSSKRKVERRKAAYFCPDPLMPLRKGDQPLSVAREVSRIKG